LYSDLTSKAAAPLAFSKGMMGLLFLTVLKLPGAFI